MSQKRATPTPECDVGVELCGARRRCLLAGLGALLDERRAAGDLDVDPAGLGAGVVVAADLAAIASATHQQPAVAAAILEADEGEDHLDEGGDLAVLIDETEAQVLRAAGVVVVHAIDDQGALVGAIADVEGLAGEGGGEELVGFHCGLRFCDVERVCNAALAGHLNEVQELVRKYSTKKRFCQGLKLIHKGILAFKMGIKRTTENHENLVE